MLAQPFFSAVVQISRIFWRRVSINKNFFLRFFRMKTQWKTGPFALFLFLYTSVYISALYQCSCVLVQSSVIPLSKLLVREKGDTRDSRGVYLIYQSKTEPDLVTSRCDDVTRLSRRCTSSCAGRLTSVESGFRRCETPSSAARKKVRRRSSSSVFCRPNFTRIHQISVMNSLYGVTYKKCTTSPQVHNESNQ